MENFSKIVFKYRSYTPIPFLIVMVFLAEPTIYTMVGGFAIILIGEFFRLWGVTIAGSETRTTGDVGGTYLVVTGPFAYVRNPLYLGNILIYFGVGIMSMALFPYLQIGALLFFYVQYRIIIKGEEDFLEKKFGEEYIHFRSKVPRLIPSLKKYSNTKLEQPPFNFAAGLKSERRTLQAISLVTFLIIIIYVVNF